MRGIVNVRFAFFSVLALALVACGSSNSQQQPVQQPGYYPQQPGQYPPQPQQGGIVVQPRRSKRRPRSNSGRFSRR